MADVLVVDDDPAVCELLSILVTQLGHEARTAGTAEDALIACMEHRPDLLLLDLSLPGRDGDELVDLLARGVGRPRSIVIVSARPPEAIARIAQRFGVRALHKPFDAEAFEEAVTAALDEVVEDLQGRPRGAPLDTDDDRGVLVSVDVELPREGSTPD